MPRTPGSPSRCPHCSTQLDAQGSCPNCDAGKATIVQVLNSRYRLLQSIGGGGTGSVYEALDLKTNLRVAVKVLKREPGQGGNTARLEQEARAASALHHPAIVTVTDFGWTDDEQPFLVMELFPGRSLAQLLQVQKRLPAIDALQLFQQIAAGLQHAHTQGVLHRDIKPSNIMVGHTTDGRLQAKLIDFGGSDLISAKMKQFASDSVVDCSGSPFYMSPEQCTNTMLDERSDLFSLGCTLFEALTGAPPFSGSNVMETIHKRTLFDAPRLNGTNNTTESAAYSAELECIVAKLLKRSPAERYQSAAALLIDLCTETSRLEPSNSPLINAGRRTNTDSAKGITRNLLIVALALSCLLIGGIVCWRVFFTQTHAADSTVQTPQVVIRRSAAELHALGQQSLEAGNATAAQQYFRDEMAVLLSANTPDLEKIARCNGELGNASALNSDYAAAEKFYLNGTTILSPVASRKPSSRCAMADINVQLAVNYLHAKKPGEALAHFQKALALDVPHGSWPGAHACAQKYAALLQRQGRVDEATRVSQQYGSTEKTCVVKNKVREN